MGFQVTRFFALVLGLSVSLSQTDSTLDDGPHIRPIHQSFLQRPVFIIAHQFFDATGEYAGFHNYYNNPLYANDVYCLAGCGW
ncbi:hypothetical protein AAIA72_11960 [Hahella sp. SMD15-11]|uniref:Uncharacterized protein n=1 Tax=Thermohahella caldifontis TaxID=3142973 RepID=A0AB39UU25_9GAMM